jgi:hypothetical protein
MQSGCIGPLGRRLDATMEDVTRRHLPRATSLQEQASVVMRFAALQETQMLR